MKKIILFCAVATLLSACGGSNNNTVAVTPPPVATGSGDTFLDSVIALVGVSTDDASAVATDGIAVTSPDDTAPVAVM